MNAEVSTLLGKMQAMLTGFISLLPNLVLALIVFTIFFFVARAIKKIVRNLTRDHRQARNLGMVLGRLAQGVTILVGLFIALSIVIPSLKAGDLVQLLGISSVAIAVIAPFTHTKADRAALLRHANMIDRGSQEGIVEELDRNDVKERYLAAVKAIEQR